MSRTFDRDGRLHVVANISRASVDGYLGSELAGGARLLPNYRPDRIYQIFRDPVELAKAAPTFNNLPVLDLHHAKGLPDADKVIGSTGTDARFVSPFLTASIVIWSGPALKKIGSGEQRDLSSAYRYELDPTPGVWEGRRYDARMKNIAGSHVALVENGRVEGCLIEDAARRRTSFHELLLKLAA